MSRRPPAPMQPQLFAAAPPDPYRAVATTPELVALLLAGAPVAIGVSGGKDSCVQAFAVMAYLDAIGHTGPRVLVHADLGRVEWRDSLPTCQRLAAHLGLELVVVRRASGDMMDRWLQRWADNVERYRSLECVKLIPPWSSAAMRFCTSELKVAPICRDLVRRFPGTTIVNAVGIRREESPGRRKAPITKTQTALASATHRTRGLNWNPVLDFTEAEVFERLRLEGFEPHEGYSRFGMSRISCAFCVIGGADDLRAATTCADNAPVYREMVDLEIASTFSLQADRWLGDVAPHLLTEDQRAQLQDAKRMALVRQAEEARIPEHLLYEKGWPTVLPTSEEAALLADVRLKVAAAVGLEGVSYLDPGEISERYGELFRLARRKEGA